MRTRTLKLWNVTLGRPASAKIRWNRCVVGHEWSGVPIVDVNTKSDSRHRYPDQRRS